MTDAELKALCEQVGMRLTNKPVQVRFQNPAWKGVKGTACKRGRTAVVDISPGMSAREFLLVLLHELGHVKSLWHSWTVSLPEYEPGSLRLPESFRTAGSVSLAEAEANELALEWFRYSERHSGKYSGSWLVKRLNALTHYLEPELVAIQKRAVDMAVQSVLKGR